jgi:hypothetical protein
MLTNLLHVVKFYAQLMQVWDTKNMTDNLRKE